MNHALATCVLFFLALALLALPLLPALNELRRQNDAEPLRLIQQHGGDIRHFAIGFRRYIDALRMPLKRCVASGTTSTGKLSNGSEYILLGRSDNSSFRGAGKEKEATCPLVVATGVDTEFPPGLTFLKEVYASGQFVGGEESSYRAILGEKDVLLQRSSTVMRWAHAAGYFQADHNCDLYGRISSDREILLQSGCIFQRLNAPRIVAGSEAGLGLSPTFEMALNGSAPEGPVGRKLIQGDWEIRSGEVVTGNIVVRGKLRIGAGAQVFGSIKSKDEMVVESGVTVEGSLFSASTIHIGPRCQVRGLVIAEHGMVIESGAQCGTAKTPTTVSAPIIDVEEGSLFFGTLWAREQGRVVPKS